MPNLDWMKSLCRTDGAGQKFTREPLSVIAWKPDGSPDPWTVATEGHFLLAVRGAGDGFKGMDDKDRAKIDPVLIRLLSGVPANAVCVPLAALKEWCGPPPTDARCDCCRGRGHHECPRCEDDHECGQCGGSGRVRESKPRPGVVAGMCIDRLLLAKALSHLAAPAEIHAATGDKQLRLFAADWRLALIVIEPAAKDAPAPAFDAAFWAARPAETIPAFNEAAP